ncbi:MAG: hypothetical protein E7452_02705 [Ruminococcaceae bacterium]|nr:hypothetical protein [Oscillospiraceae bacterium]
MRKYREKILDVFNWTVHAMVSFVAASLAAHFVFGGLLRDFLEGVWKWERQTTYNVTLLAALFVAGVIYATVILRFRRYEVQDVLKGGESIGDILKKRFWLQNSIFLAVFAVAAFVLAQVGVTERLWIGTSIRAGKNIFSSDCEAFWPPLSFIAACGAFVPIIPQGWLAWVCNVSAYAAMLWGGTWWFVYRTDRKLLGKKMKKT